MCNVSFLLIINLKNSLIISGEDCGKVVIWNMGPIRDEKEEADLSTPRILCQMDNHLGIKSFLL